MQASTVAAFATDAQSLPIADKALTAESLSNTPSFKRFASRARQLPLQQKSGPLHSASHFAKTVLQSMNLSSPSQQSLGFNEGGPDGKSFRHSSDIGGGCGPAMAF